MADQYSGNMLAGLMAMVDHKPEISRPDVEIGGIVVDLGGLKVSVGPEVLESWRRIEAEKHKAIASGKPLTWGHTGQTQDPASEAMMKAIAREAGFPDLFD